MPRFLRNVRLFWQKAVKQAKRNNAPYDLNRELVERLKTTGDVKERIVHRRLLKATLRTRKFQEVVQTLQKHVNDGMISREGALGAAGWLCNGMYQYHAGIEKNKGHPDIAPIVERARRVLNGSNPKNLEEVFGYDPFPIGGHMSHIDRKNHKTISFHFQPERCLVLVRNNIRR